MKVLISAIACLPEGGSEASVGWAVVKQIAADHDVFVLVSGRFREGWARARKMGIVPSNIRERFIGDPGDYHSNRLVARLESWREYLQFNSSLVDQARAWHREIGFDVIHQVTYATWRVPTPLWRVGPPVIWGPIGGTGRVPFSFYKRMGLVGSAFEFAREVSSWKAYHSQALRDALKNCAVVIAANRETHDFLSPLADGRGMPIIPVMAFSEQRISQVLASPSTRNMEGPLRLFAGGNMIASKGLAMALRALARSRDSGLDFRYLVAGGGPDFSRVRALCASLRLNELIEFHPGFRNEDYLAALHNAHIYFLPSLRETTPVTMLEAMLAGCVPVVADISAPGEIVARDVGCAVPFGCPSELEIGLSDALLELARERGILRSFSNSAAQLVQKKFSDGYRRAEFARVYASVEI